MVENVSRQQWESMSRAQQGRWAQWAMQQGAEGPLPARGPWMVSGAESPEGEEQHSNV
jgi:hypothetical protein